MVGNHQGIGVQADFLPIQQGQLFALLGHTHADTTLNLAQVEGVHGLPQFQQHIVGNIHHRINGADTAATQLFHHPQRRRRFDIHALNNTTEVTRAGFRCQHLNNRRITDTDHGRLNVRALHRRLIQYADFAGQSGNA